MLWCFIKNSIAERNGVIFKYLTEIENNDHFMVWHVFYIPAIVQLLTLS